MDPKKRPQKQIMSDMVATHKQSVSKQASSSREAVVNEKTVEKIKYVEKAPVVERVAFQEVIEYEADEEDASVTEPVRFRRSDFNDDQTEKNAGGVFWFIAFVGMIALIFGIGGLLMHATITITPKKYTGPVDDSITMSETRTAGELTFATATKTFTQEQTVPATSFASQTSTASGTVRFYNAGKVSETIRAGAILVSSEGNQYITKSRITVPSQKGTAAGQADVIVTAAKTGSVGNDGLDDFTFLNASPNLSTITIRSLTPISGGEDGQDAIADPTQVAQAETNLQSNFSDTDSLIQRMSNEIPTGMIVLPIVFPASAPTVTTDAGHADGVHVIASETVTIVLVAKSDVGMALAGSLGVLSGVPVALPSFDGLTVTTGNTISNQNIPQTMSIRVTGTATLVGQVNADQIKSEIAGLSRKIASQKIMADPAVATFDIHMVPFWRRILPLDLDKISVLVNNP